MAQFNASFSKAISGSILTSSVLTLTDTSNYDISDPVITRSDFYARRFIIRDINNTIIQTLTLVGTDVATFNVGNLLSLQPVYLQITFEAVGYGGAYTSIAPFYLPTLIS